MSMTSARDHLENIVSQWDELVVAWARNKPAEEIVARKLRLQATIDYAKRDIKLRSLTLE